MRAPLVLVALTAMLVGCGEVPNQPSASAGNASAGKAVFDQHCAACHGTGGDVRHAEQYDADTPDLRRIAAGSPGGRIPRVMLAKIIDGRGIVQAHGNRTMPIWGEIEAIDAVGAESLVAYIETIQIR